MSLIKVTGGRLRVEDTEPKVIKISGQGPQGPTGTVITNAGAWTTGATYSAQSFVSQAGSSYLCAVGHTAGTFSTDLAAGKWTLIAEKGATGSTGAQGSSGVVAVNAPITNTGDSSNANLGLNTSGLVTASTKASSTDQTVSGRLRVSQSGQNHALSTTLSATSGEDITALNVVSTNPDSSAVWVTGREYGHGTIKVSHVQPDGGSDANAAALSINLSPNYDYQKVTGTASFSSGTTSVSFTPASGVPTVGQAFRGTGVPSTATITGRTGSGPYTLTLSAQTTSASDANEYLSYTPTAVQGIYLDTYKTTPGVGDETSSGTTGALLNLKNAGSQKLVLTKDGQAQLPQTGSTGGVRFGSGGTASNLYQSSSNILIVQNSSLYTRPNGTTLAGGTEAPALFTSAADNGVGPTRSPFTVGSKGKLEWGAEVAAGGTIPSDQKDVNLYRNSAGELKTDSGLTVAGNVNLQSGTASQYVKTDSSKNLTTTASIPVADVSGAEAQANKNQANGYAGLDSSGLIQSSQLPALSISDTFVVASQAAMLALTAQTGDVAVRTDVSKSFILTATPASTLGNWQELLTPPDTVTSVAGRTGNVTLANTDISGLGSLATKSTVTSADITDGTIATADLADAAITTAKIATGAVVTADLADGAITDAKQALSTQSSRAISSTNKIVDYNSDPFAHARSSECATMPRLAANISNTMVSGTIYSARAVYTGNQSSNQFTNIRFMLPSITSTTFTQLRAVVYDSTGTIITNGYTADLSGSATASTLMTGALNSTITLTAGTVYYLGIVAVFTGTAPTFRGMVTSAAIAGVTPQLSRSATGYTTGIPGSVSSATALIPWVELT